MPSLADLRDPYAAQNRQKRDFAYSGQADTADIPWLYAIQAGQGGRGPSGIGEGQGGADDAAAPNPQSLASLGGGASGGGSSGAADVGLPGPGLSGEEDIEALQSFFERGGDRGFGGLDSFDRGFGDLPVGDIDEFGGYSTLGSLAGLLPIPFAGTAGGLVGGIADIVRDYSDADDFDPTGTSGGFRGFIDAALAELSGDQLGTRAFDSRVDNYKDRTQTGLGSDALGATRDVKRGRKTYSGPKGVVGPRDRGGQRGERGRGPGGRGGGSTGRGGGFGGQQADIA
ncbi:hypothetical protein HBA54_04155 [Pelagibius litoralis]|uniref:Uncharacterized protein n=1 Tax=Pelagibius litoralis TaxID=374515 RepID=A0A967EX54_9PROT|nr:hypothetical protein [Pelagibius litoralis]NIA67775.1 hypothetical protein [Pelagibius litoralis]